MEVLGFILLHPYWMIAIAIVAEGWPILAVLIALAFSGWLLSR